MQEVSTLIGKVVSDLFNVQEEIELARPDEEFGDFSTNVALKLAKRLGKNPREVAETIARGLVSDQIAKVEIAGPGFINLYLTDKALYELAKPTGRASTNQTVVIETNNPNPFKAMHIGHAFNAVLGDTIANLLEARGAKTYRVSYHGDVGLHVGKSMYSLLNFVKNEPEGLQNVPSSERNSFMSKMYARGSKAYKDDPKAKAEIDELSKQSFTREDPVYAGVYDICKAWSFAQIDQIVASLGNKPVERKFLESDADTRGVPIVKKNTPQVFTESDGALVFEGSKYGSFDNVFVTSRGLGLYGARDLGLMQLKNEQYHPDKSYIVTAEEQRDYFKGVLAAAGMIWPDLKNQTVNISTGTVKLSTGKMSSREGDVLEIGWLFDQIQEAIKNRGGEPTLEVMAGAIRYQFLKVRIGSDVTFDINKAVSLTGNSGPYLQYAFARASSILAKSQVTNSKDQTNLGLERAERSLLRKIGEYSEAVERALGELMPHHICTYLFELAQAFNKFYEDNRVIGDEREAVRIGLVSRYATTLKNGLELLGINAPDKM